MLRKVGACSTDKLRYIHAHRAFFDPEELFDLMIRTRFRARIFGLEYAWSRCHTKPLKAVSNILEVRVRELGRVR